MKKCIIVQRWKSQQIKIHSLLIFYRCLKPRSDIFSKILDIFCHSQPFDRSLLYVDFLISILGNFLHSHASLLRQQEVRKTRCAQSCSYLNICFVFSVNPLVLNSTTFCDSGSIHYTQTIQYISSMQKNMLLTHSFVISITKHSTKIISIATSLYQYLLASKISQYSNFLEKYSVLG